MPPARVHLAIAFLVIYDTTYTSALGYWNLPFMVAWHIRLPLLVISDTTCTSASGCWKLLFTVAWHVRLPLLVISDTTFMAVFWHLASDYWKFPFLGVWFEIALYSNLTCLTASFGSPWHHVDDSLSVFASGYWKLPFMGIWVEIGFCGNLTCLPAVVDMSKKTRAWCVWRVR